jgi:hypothetical protein
VPVVVEVILERVTNISMGTEINAVNEFEDLAWSATTRQPPSRCSTDCLTPPRTGVPGALIQGDNHASLRCQPVHAVHRTGLPGRFKAAADAGFSGVEYLFPYDFSAAEIKQQRPTA